MQSAQLSLSSVEPQWSLRELFVSPLARITDLACRPDVLTCSCEKCAVDHQLVFLRRGGFVKHVSNEALVANANKVVFFRAWEPYRTSHLDPSGDNCVVISFGDETLEACQATTSALRCSHAVIGPAIARAGRALAERIDMQSCDELEVEERTIALLRAAFTRNDAAPPRRPGAKARACIHSVESLLTLDYRSTWSLTRLGRSIGRSPFHLAHLFRDVTGMSVHRYLINLRLAEGLQRLLQGEDNIAALAADLGFASHAHFSTSFKTIFGIAPSSVRSATRPVRTAMARTLRATRRPH